MKLIVLFVLSLITFVSFSQTDSVKVRQFCFMAGDASIVHETDTSMYVQIRNYPGGSFGSIRDDYYLVSKNTLKTSKIVSLEKQHMFVGSNIVGIAVQHDNKNTGAKRGVRVRLLNPEKSESKVTFVEATGDVKYSWNTSAKAYSSKNCEHILLVIQSYTKVETRTQSVVLDKDLNVLHTFESTLEEETSTLSTIADDGSVYLVTTKGKLVCYNASKDFERWEQDIIIDNEEYTGGGFSNLRAAYNKDTLTLKTDYKNFLVEIPINYYTKEVEQIKFINDAENDNSGKRCGDVRIATVELKNDKGAFTAKMVGKNVVTNEDIFKVKYFTQKKMKKFEITSEWISKTGKSAYYTVQQDGFNGKKQHLIRVDFW